MGKEYDIIPLRYNYIIPNTNTLNNYGDWKPDKYNYKNNLIYWSLSTGFDTSNVTSIYSMFYSCSSLQSLDLSKFTTSKVTDMNAMFSGCSSLQSLDLSNFDTSKVNNMGSLFNSCSSLQSLDLSSFDTSNVTNMSTMFKDCSSLQSLDLSNFDTSKVTKMNYMFGYTKDNKISYIKCKQAFKDWCIANNDKIYLKTNLDDITWDIVG